MEKNLFRRKAGLHFADFSQFELKWYVCYERKVRGELLGCFFYCTLEWLRMSVLQLLWSVSVTMKHPTQLIQKRYKK